MLFSILQADLPDSFKATSPINSPIGDEGVSSFASGDFSLSRADSMYFDASEDFADVEATDELSYQTERDLVGDSSSTSTLKTSPGPPVESIEELEKTKGASKDGEMASNGEGVAEAETSDVDGKTDQNGKHSKDETHTDQDKEDKDKESKGKQSSWWPFGIFSKQEKAEPDFLIKGGDENVWKDDDDDYEAEEDEDGLGSQSKGRSIASNPSTSRYNGKKGRNKEDLLETWSDDGVTKPRPIYGRRLASDNKSASASNVLRPKSVSRDDDYWWDLDEKDGFVAQSADEEEDEGDDYEEEYEDAEDDDDDDDDNDDDDDDDGIGSSNDGPSDTKTIALISTAESYAGFDDTELKEEPTTTEVSRKEMEQIDLQLSLCGHLEHSESMSNAEWEQLFQEKRVSFEQFNANPNLLNDAGLVVKFNDRYYPWSIVGPVVISMIVFGRPLDKQSVEQMEAEYVSQSSWFGQRSQSIDDENNEGESSSSDKGKDKDSEEEKVAAVTKSKLPSSSQLLALNLKYGANTIQFTVTSRLQGTQELSATIYFWKPNDKIVISDIDGTITRSDVLGHILPAVGRDWSHSGVSQLYTNVVKNNYKILYLTSRAIGQVNTTRSYLKSIKQGDALYTLPPGPVMTSPNRLFESFTREVILRKPEEFKIACLQEIRDLFPENCPFHAGFGNRETDVVSYQAVGINVSKIFIINPKGEIRVPASVYKTSYAKINDLVEEMFPELNETKDDREKRVVDKHMFNDFNFWKMPPIQSSKKNSEKESSNSK
eukprot:TRINITY_DN3538_c1_g1_i1.p1 TRINITY_DN3538_c1_g1~~TRINITY_DN3538_c1_g1_i1.p1  ORF type:complete len:771 (+),score=275.69 TRINITY_DN3538_c1_g1_i1:406-2718(+)